ncbi:hypothetical protein V2P24_03300 [Mycoplasma putrefaciens]|uniref:hypothetical protein n=1 Tax=Mycoplasma putrefaciens TaxID=2123 RepID=UPI003DA6C87E
MNYTILIWDITQILIPKKIGGKNFKKAIKDIVISHVAFAYNFETLARAVEKNR